MSDYPHEKTGGPAFPTPDLCQNLGMTLRDWFAGQALARCALAYYSNDDKIAHLENTAKYCYALADTMLAERERGE